MIWPFVRGLDRGFKLYELFIHKSSNLSQYQRVDTSKKGDAMLSKGLLTSALVTMTLLGTLPSITPAQAQSAAEAEIVGFHQLCDKGDRRACVRFGILIGEARERHAEWRRTHPEWWWWER